MIILDTNVLSEIMKPEPNGRVIGWLDSLIIDETGVTSITVAEIMYGISSLSKGKRRSALLETASAVFDQDFAGRIFSFDAAAAIEYALIVHEREKSGLPISMADAQIAGICRAGAFTLATRNSRDFKKTGIELINPWEP